MRRGIVVVGLFGVVCLNSVVSAPVPPAGSPWVTLKGRVVWPEAWRMPEKRTVPDGEVRDKEICCSNGPVEIEDLAVNARNRGLRNVVVWLRPDSDDAAAAIPREKIHPDLRTPKPVHHVIEYRVCQIRPRVTAAHVGDTLEAKNPGTVADNIRADGNELLFNILMKPGAGYKHATPLPLEAIPVQLASNIHPWMKGYLRTFDHPYFAVTDADGRFEMRRVPAGNWRLVYWHEYGYHKGGEGRLGFRITVKDDGEGTCSLLPWEYEHR